MTLETDHPFSHSVRLPKINEWAAEGKWLTRTSQKFADPDLLKFCLPNAKLNTSLLHSVYNLPKSSLGFPPFSVAPSSGNNSEIQKKAAQVTLFSWWNDTMDTSHTYTQNHCAYVKIRIPNAVWHVFNNTNWVNQTTMWDGVRNLLGWGNTLIRKVFLPWQGLASALCRNDFFHVLNMRNSTSGAVKRQNILCPKIL